MYGDELVDRVEARTLYNIVRTGYVQQGVAYFSPASSLNTGVQCASKGE